MSLGIETFSLKCDAKGCKYTEVVSSAKDAEDKSWVIMRLGCDHRDWVELGDKTLCPAHTPALEDFQAGGKWNHYVVVIGEKK